MTNSRPSEQIIKAVNPAELLNYSGTKRVPLIMQSEVAECGLASLAMIASYYGHKINVAPLRKYLLLHSQGMNLRQMMEVAGKLELSSRAVQCDLNQLNQLKLPCVLHWDLNHFVVLTRITKSGIYINDPAMGKRKLSIDEFSHAYTGIALEITPTTSFKKQDVRVVMKVSQLWEKITGLKRSLFSLLLLSLVMQLIALISPYYMQWIVDDVLLSNDKSLLIVLAVGFTLLMFIRVSVSAFRSWLVMRFSSSINIQMGANLFYHLIRLPMDYFEKRHIGDVVSRFGSMSAIRNLLTTGVIEAIIDGVMAVVVVVMMFLYSPLLAALVIFVVLISFIIQLLFYYPNRRITEESIIAQAKEDSNFLETIRAIQTIKLFSHETNRQNIWLNRYAEVINADIRLKKINIVEGVLHSVVWGLENILIVYFGALTVMEGHLTVGMLLAFISYKGQFTSSVIAFINKIISFKLLGLHLERLSDITLQNREQNESQAALSCPLHGSIKAENLSFRYSDNSEWIIKDLSFEISPGENVAITGASGCGKTTLMKLILGLQKPSSGKLFIDNIDINELSLHDYRRHFGAVMQDDTLLSGTLAENITMFDANYNEEKLIQCCKEACIWEDIKVLPMGLNSLVGDMGNSFSGGQLQRIFLARALYKNPLILCLDESTSHLDHENECSINHNISQLNMTRIVIAHRKETIASADRCLVLDEV